MMVERTGRPEDDAALLEALGQDALDKETQTWNEDAVYKVQLASGIADESERGKPPPLLLQQGKVLQEAFSRFFEEPLGPGDTLLVHHLQNDFISGSMKARSSTERPRPPCAGVGVSARAPSGATHQVSGATEAGKFDSDDGKHGGDLVCFCAELVKVFRNAGALIVLSQDYHPPEHVSFASTHGALRRTAARARERRADCSVVRPRRRQEGQVAARDGGHVVRPAGTVARPLRARHSGREHAGRDSARGAVDAALPGGAHRLPAERGLVQARAEPAQGAGRGWRRGAARATRPAPSPDPLTAPSSTTTARRARG